MREECEGIRERLIDASAGREPLSGDEREHVGKCADCAAFREELESASTALGRLPELDTDPKRTESLMTRLRSEGLLTPPKPEPALDADDRLKLKLGERRLSLRWVKRFAVAACLVAMIGTLAYITSQAIREETPALAHAAVVRGDVTFTADGVTVPLQKLRNYPGGEIATDDTSRAKLVLKGDTCLEIDTGSKIDLADSGAESPREVVLRSEYGRFWVECNGPVRFNTPQGWVESAGTGSKYVLELRPAEPDHYVRWDRTRERVDLVFRNAGAPDVFAQITEITGVNIVVRSNGEIRTITGSFKGLERDEVLDAARTMAEVNGFDIEETGEGLVLSASEGATPCGLPKVTVYMFDGSVTMRDKGGEHRLEKGMVGRWRELQGGGAGLRIEKCDDLVTPMAWRGKLHNPRADGFEIDDQGNFKVYRRIPRIVTVSDFGEDESYRVTLVGGAGLTPGAETQGFRLVGVRAGEGVAGFVKGDRHYVSFVTE